MTLNEFFENIKALRGAGFEPYLEKETNNTLVRLRYYKYPQIIFCPVTAYAALILEPSGFVWLEKPLLYGGIYSPSPLGKTGSETVGLVYSDAREVIAAADFSKHKLRRQLLEALGLHKNEIP